MGPSFWQLMIILIIVLLLFGTKKLRSVGKDLGGAVKGFRSELDKDKSDDEHTTAQMNADEHEAGRVIEGQVNREDREKT